MYNVRYKHRGEELAAVFECFKKAHKFARAVGGQVEERATW